MGAFEGLLGGFAARKYQREREQLDEAQRAADRESRVYEALLSSEDPEIQAIATSGLLESTQPRRRKRGMRGWLGEIEGSQTFSRLQELINTPITTTEKVMTRPAEPGLPSKQITPTIRTAPSLEEAPMGTPSTSLTEPGAPPAQPLQYTQQPGPMVGRPPEFETRQVTKARRIFPTAEESALRESRAKARGDIEGEVAGMVAAGIPEERAREAVLAKAERAARGGTFGVREGNIRQATEADQQKFGTPAGTWIQDLYGPTGDVVRQLPASSPITMSTRTPTKPELVAFRLYGKEGEDPRAMLTSGRLTPMQMHNVNERMKFEVTEQPMDMAQRFNAVTKLQDDWRQISTKHVELERQLGVMRTAWNLAQKDNLAIPPAKEAIIVAFQRMLDPDSVVREAEARRPTTMQPLIGRVESALEALRAGGPITMERLRPYVTLSEEIEAAAKRVMSIERDRIESTGRQFQLGPLNLYGGGTIGSTVGTAPPGATPPAPTAPAAPGAPTPPPGRTTATKDAKGNWILQLP